MGQNTTPHGERPRQDNSQSSATNEIRKAKNSQADAAASIGFPKKIGEMRHMRISAFQYDRAARRRRLNVKTQGNHTVFLPIPAELQVAANALFGMEGMLTVADLSQADGATQQVSALAVEGAQKKGVDIAKGVTDGLGVSAEISARMGQSVNPKTELTYQANGLREFTFTFTLTPKDEEEAKRIRKIKQFFLKNAYSPTDQGGANDAVFLKYPNIFTIGFFDEFGREMKNLFFIMPCHLINVQIQENPHGQSSFIKGQDGIYPLSTSLTISFQEARMLDQTDFNDWEVTQV